MKLYNTNFLIFLFLLFFSSLLISSPAKGDTPITNATQDVAAQVVSHGFELFLYAISDNIIGMASVGVESNFNRSLVPQLAFLAITYNDNPFSYDWVQAWQNMFLVIYVMAVICFVIFGGGIMVLTRKMGGKAHRTLSYLFADTVADVDLHNWMRRLTLSIMFGFFTTLGIWMLLYLNDILTTILADRAIAIVPFTADNVVAYFVMAIGYFIIGIIMAIRGLLLAVFVAGGLGIAILYLIPLTENLAKTIFFRMLGIIFLQPILILIAAIGLSIVQHSPVKFIPYYYIGLIVILVWVSVKIVFGRQFTDALTNTASKVVLLI
jgi:hypothetical protein